ncbi:AAA family ATPase [Burkholderia glumae]|uniref:AAA family ATPase n=1 Tax=Burkholderia glumae TaxID=337 RepID=A0AAP9Y1A0_BURGL|nr:AAA family ATPase [Burkholderia glumae]ACR29832.1 ATPase-like protein [Burkholderia glumae BGR1]AJY67452.1 AAA domain protein [Burkholderia glumae LMG 2196 = ATCC 33617]KHJ60842.1 ATPase [Burkholderia glumae]MCM2482546.1 AAA family ATPase [Burkholderia glumae]MCM2507311.1 AAA family ATPase [Burkholderia glumae]
MRDGQQADWPGQAGPVRATQARGGAAAPPFFVVTGGPGAGKSTLVDALAARGLARTDEAGRGVIVDQVAIDGPALPWRDRAAFAELMLAWEMRSYAMAERVAARGAGPVLFDRGVPDVIGYLRLCGLPVPPHVLAAARRYRYRSPVFLAPPWPEIYVRDAERKQDYAEAVRTAEVMSRVYRALGYRLVELPCVAVEARCRFVLDTLAADGSAHAR